MKKANFETTAFSPMKKQPVLQSKPALIQNVLSFSHSSHNQNIRFALNPSNDLHRINAYRVHDKVQKLLPAVAEEQPYYYLTFDPLAEGHDLQIDLRYNYSLARAFYNHHIREILAPKADALFFNFLNDTQFWFADHTVKKPGLLAYQKYTLRYITDFETVEPGLLICYNGTSYSTLKSVEDIMNQQGYEFDLTDIMIFNNRVITYHDALQVAGNDLNKVFPKLNPRLRNHLGLEFTMRKNDKKLSNHWTMISSFYETYLNNAEFKSVIPHEGKWKPVAPYKIDGLNNTRPVLLFNGNNTGEDIIKSLTEFGPYQFPNNLNIKVFIIHHHDHLAQAQALSSHFYSNNGITSIKALTHLPFQYVERLNIIFSGTGNPIHEIERKIRLMALDPNAAYYAFYISPYTLFEPDIELRKVYYRVNEILLRRNIVVQTIERQKINSPGFKFFIANMGIAMIGKLGGIPWILKRKQNNGLVIGLGAYRSMEHQVKYIGSMFSLSIHGLFRESDVVRADDTWALAGKIQQAMLRLIDETPDIGFLIIHYHKTITRKEFEPVERFLRNLDFKIPVCLVGFLKSASKDTYAFDHLHPDQLPPNGTYIETSPGKYLVYLNDRIDNSPVNKAPLPFKIEIKMMNVQSDDLSRMVRGIFDHMHYLCYMHWRSVKQKKIPVTINYPLLLAQRKPWFSDSEMPRYAKDKLWFL